MAEGGVKIVYKKKKGDGHGFHGGSWKVAMADFMTSMFAFFLVLWILSQSQEVKSATASYFRHPEDFEGLKDVIFEGGSGVDSDSRGRPDIRARIHREDKSREAVPIMKPTSPGKNPEFLVGAPPSEEPPNPKLNMPIEYTKPDKAQELISFLKLKDMLMKELGDDKYLRLILPQIKIEASNDGLIISLIEQREVKSKSGETTQHYKSLLVKGQKEFTKEINLALGLIGSTVAQMKENKIEIGGHGPGPETRYFDDTNKQIWFDSAKLAMMVRKKLTKAGVADNQVMRITGFGAQFPLDNPLRFNEGERARNFPRRIVIVIRPHQYTFKAY